MFTSEAVVRDRLYQSQIDLTQWAPVHDALTEIAHQRLGAWGMTQGRHPCLGSVLLIEDHGGLLLLTENPLEAIDPDFIPDDEQPIPAPAVELLEAA